MTDRPDTTAREPMAHGAAHELTHRLFHRLPRADQRRWAGAYLTGLLTTPGKKSVRNMGWAVCSSYTASQSLHQAVNESTWSWTDVRAELTSWCRERTEVRGWALGRVTLPKRGRYSAGVHRRFDPAAGRTLNCQLGIGLFLLTGRGAAVPVDWRLHLPDEWLDDTALRRRARIPDTVRAGSPGRLMVELAAAAGGSGAPVVADAETVAEAAELIGGLTALGTDWAVSVPAATPVLAGPSTAGRRPATGPAGGVAVTAGTLARQLRGPARAPGTGAPDAPVVLPALVRTPEADRPLRLVAARTPGARSPERLWLTTLHGRRLAEAAGLFRIPAVDPATLTGLDDCGLRDFEGRSYPGWHRHMTLVSAAYGHRALGADAVRHAERLEVRAA
ncbi:IS701 family transposase [Streptomyces lavendulocolor]|uniref:IS701 family transposase n=1 Tax=Streptomyces lavendulocolor TaxID=67316 RepID=UPI003C2E99EA